MTKRIAIVARIHPRKLGSMEDWIIGLSRSCSGLGPTTVVTYGPCHPDFSVRLLEAGVSWFDLQQLETSFLSARDWFRAHGDVVHFSLLAPRDKLLVAAQSIGGTKVIFQDCVSTESNASDAIALPARVLDALTFRRVHSVVAVSNFVAARIRKRFRLQAPKLQVVYNGVDEQRFYPHSSSSACEDVLCVAALHREKGVDLLIKAFARVSAVHTRLRIVGDGPDRLSLRNLADALGIGERVDFLGLRSDVDRFLAQAAIVVHPAIWGEAFGLTIAEAMSCCRPIVAFDVGAVRELVDTESSGLLVQKGNDTAMSQAIARLLNNPSERDAMGTAGRQRVIERFSMHGWIDAHTALIQNALDSPHATW